MKPIGQCLCAVGFGTSSFDAEVVYMDAFVRPLYLPPVQDTYGRIKRLKRPGGSRLTGTDEQIRHVLNAVREQAIPFFQVADSPEKIASAFDQSPGFLSRLLTLLRMTKRFAPVTDPYELEAIAMSCVLLRDKEGARRALVHAVQRLVDDGREWSIAMADRLRATNDGLESDFDALAAELPKWRQQNLEARGLTQYQA